MKKGLNKGQTAVLILMLSIIVFQGIYLFRTSKETSSLQESSAANGEIQKSRKILREITQFNLGDFPFFPNESIPRKNSLHFHSMTDLPEKIRRKYSKPWIKTMQGLPFLCLARMQNIILTL